MQQREFIIKPSRLAPALFIVAYALALWVLLWQLDGYWALGFASAWLYFAARDLQRFGFYPRAHTVALRFLPENAASQQWQLRIDRISHHADCRLYFSCPLYLLLEWREAPKSHRWQFVWRDSLSSDDWHALGLYLELAAAKS
ncbi:MAG: protein YgfX [Pseudomonadales bacterium]